MTTSQASQIHELHRRIAALERENGILQHQHDSLLRQIEDLQYALHREKNLFDRIAALEPPISDDDTERDLPAQVS